MKISTLRIVSTTVLAGNGEFSLVFSVPANGARYLIPDEKNVLIKKIECFANNSSSGSFCLKYWDIRFLLLNRDISIQQNVAGIINNPISGDWGSAFVKDVNTDFNISSKKSFIEFQDGILAGGISPRSISVLFNVPNTTNQNIRFFLTVYYESL
jgi:hypothetical protein